jgi:hypothetical protein
VPARHRRLGSGILRIHRARGKVPVGQTLPGGDGRVAADRLRSTKRGPPQGRVKPGSPTLSAPRTRIGAPGYSCRTSSSGRGAEPGIGSGFVRAGDWQFLSCRHRRCDGFAWHRQRGSGAPGERARSRRLPDSLFSGMVSARSRRATSTDSISQAAAPGSAPGRLLRSAWARRMRSAKCAAIARRAVRAGAVSSGKPPSEPRASHVALSASRRPSCNSHSNVI